MRLVKVAIANVNSTVGAVRSNTDRALEHAVAMAEQDVTLACFPEQVIGGYPPEDLSQWRAFVAAQRRELERFAAETASFPTFYALGVTARVGGQLFNCAAAVHRGAIAAFVPKEKLPTYNVFYERRTFSHGMPGLDLDAGGIPLGDRVFELDFGTVALEVCEDAWSPDGPMRRRCFSGAEIVLNLSASPYRAGIVSTRREMLATRSADNQVVLVYANAVGGQDGLVYDGGGYIFQNGRLVLDPPRFRAGFTSAVVDLDRTTRLRIENTTWRHDWEVFENHGAVVQAVHCPGATVASSRHTYPRPAPDSFFLPSATVPAILSGRETVLDDIFECLALGTKDYFQKAGSFRCIGVALSGGRDSLLTLLVAWRAAQLAAEGATSAAAATIPIEVFYMPTRFSMPETRAAAAAICGDLRLELRTVSIDEAFERELEAARAMLGAGREPSPVTRQNIQARLRGARMWNWSNSAGGLFLQTGDMSEKAVGYTTIGGDLEGALSVIANLPKTVVIALLERLLKRFEFAGIAATLANPPGPELEANQAAEAELMPFAVLDACLALYAGDKLSPDEVAATLPAIFPEHDATALGVWARRFAQLFSASIYKWVQSPLALHVGSLDLDRERALQIPVVQRNEW